VAAQTSPVRGDAIVRLEPDATKLPAISPRDAAIKLHRTLM